MTKTDLANWFEAQYAQWMPQQPRGKRSLRAFAAYLGVGKSSLDKWINGKSTAMFRDTADLIAAKLGPEIYDLVNLPRPDPDLQRIETLWPMVHEERKPYLLKLIEKAAGDGQPATDTPTVAKTRKASA